LCSATSSTRPDHLHRAGQAARRRQDQRDGVVGDIAVAADLGQHFGRRLAVDFKYQHGVLRIVLVTELGEQRLLDRQCATGAGPQRMKRILAFAVRQAPSGVLAGQAGDDRMGRMHVDDERPVRVAHVEGRGAQATHADFRDAPTRFDAAVTVDAGVDDATAAGQCIDLDAQRVGVAHQSVDQCLHVLAYAGLRAGQRRAVFRSAHVSLLRVFPSL
jgi:hypothetical protein